ncbi:MAG: AbrB/MazE/SpoVT family DNA-binding domain-containing protein, partial [Nitrospira sp.]
MHCCPLRYCGKAKFAGKLSMAVQKLSSKNQIVIPKEVRQAMGVKGGDELLVVVKND